MSTACSSAFFSLTQAEYAAGEIKSKVGAPLLPSGNMCAVATSLQRTPMGLTVHTHTQVASAVSRSSNECCPSCARLSAHSLGLL